MNFKYKYVWHNLVGIFNLFSNTNERRLIDLRVKFLNYYNEMSLLWNNRLKIFNFVSYKSRKMGKILWITALL